MVGATDEDFARVRPLLDVMGSTVYHCGDVGTGGRTKLVNNYVAVTLCQVNAEALALSQRFGLDITRTLQVLYGTSATNGQLRLNFPNKVLVGDTTPGFTIDLHHARALVGQHHGGVGTGQHAREVEHDQAVERAGGGGGSLRHRPAQWLLRLSSTVRSASTQSLSSWFRP